MLHLVHSQQHIILFIHFSQKYVLIQAKSRRDAEKTMHLSFYQLLDQNNIGITENVLYKHQIYHNNIKCKNERKRGKEKKKKHKTAFQLMHTYTGMNHKGLRTFHLN